MCQIRITNSIFDYNAQTKREPPEGGSPISNQDQKRIVAPV